MSDNEPSYDTEEGSTHRAPEPVSDTEVPFFTMVKILLAAMAIVYCLTRLYEGHVVNDPFGAGTGNRPTGIDGAAGHGDGGTKVLPW